MVQAKAAAESREGEEKIDILDIDWQFVYIYKQEMWPRKAGPTPIKTIGIRPAKSPAYNGIMCWV